MTLMIWLGGTAVRPTLKITREPPMNRIERECLAQLMEAVARLLANSGTANLDTQRALRESASKLNPPAVIQNKEG